MEKADDVEISTEKVTYYSQLDEAAFFGQLDKIACVIDYTPTSFRVSLQKLNKQNLSELIGCCYRYRVNMQQLTVLDVPELSAYLRDRKAYWYAPIFGV
jgi:hypothetical protein